MDSIGQPPLEEPPLEEIADKAARLAHSLRKGLKIKSPQDREIELIQKELRHHYESLIFRDYLWSESRNVETDLWLRAHHEVIQAFRKALQRLDSATLNGGNGAKPVVEARKTSQAFNAYLQGASLFYKSLLKGLVLQFGLLQDLRPVLDKLGIKTINDTVAEASLVYQEPDLREKALASIQRTLVCLGDLARYREKHTKKVKAREKQDFHLCLEYYSIASLVDPASGNPHNQLAVIATYQNDPFSAVYQYYRAISVKKGFPTAQDNLAIVLRTATVEDYPLDQLNENARFRLLYIRLHAILYLKQNTERYESIERQVLSNFATLIGQRGLANEQILKVVVIAIAALQHIRLYRKPDETSKFPPDPEPKINVEAKALNLVLQLTELMFKVVCLEIKAANLDSFDKSGQQKGQTREINPAVRRLLPSLRVASAWLKINVSYIDRAGPNGRSGGTNLWNNYGNFATSLVKAYPRKQCPVLDRPLIEDIDLRNFAPLKRTMINATLAQSLAQAARGPGGGHPDEEHMMRIGDLEKDIALHVQAQGGPITYRNNVFMANEDHISTMESFERQHHVGPALSRGTQSSKNLAKDAKASTIRPVGSPAADSSGKIQKSTPQAAQTPLSNQPSFSLEGMVADLIEDEDSGDHEPLRGSEEETAVESSITHETEEASITPEKGPISSRPSAAEGQLRDEGATVSAGGASPVHAHDLLLQVLNQRGTPPGKSKNGSSTPNSPFAWPPFVSETRTPASSANWNQAAFANGARFNSTRSPISQKSFEPIKAAEGHK